MSEHTPPVSRRRRRWSGVYLLAGGLTALVHWRLGTLAPPDDALVFLAHFGPAFFFFLLALAAARRATLPPAVMVAVCLMVSAGSMAAYVASPFSLSSEVDRYRWDGHVSQAGFNPYRVAPDSPALEALRESYPHPLPYAERPALYPPLAEFLFYLGARTNWQDAVHYRLLAVFAALAGGLALIPLCRSVGLPAGRITVFLWHPLLIVETAAHAHLEAVALLFLILSLSLLVHRHHLTPMASLAVSILIRPYPLSLLPLYLRRVPLHRMVVFFLLLVVGSLPFVAAAPEFVANLRAYTSEAKFNPGGYLLVEFILQELGQPQWTRTIIAVVGLAVAGFLYFTDDGTNQSILRRAFYLCLPPILLGPVVEPRYLLWLLPFLALVPTTNPIRMAFLYLSGSVALAYVHLEWGVIPLWVSLLEYGPVAVLATWGAGRWWRARRQAAGPSVNTSPSPAVTG